MTLYQTQAAGSPHSSHPSRKCEFSSCKYLGGNVCMSPWPVIVVKALPLRPTIQFKAPILPFHIPRLHVANRCLTALVTVADLAELAAVPDRSTLPIQNSFACNKKSGCVNRFSAPVPRKNDEVRGLLFGCFVIFCILRLVWHSGRKSR